MNNTDLTFGGRIRPKEESETDWNNLTQLENQGLAFVYQRLSTNEQVKKHIYSRQAQDDLAELARRDGFPDEQIYVERRDLGISGTKGQDERKGLANLVAQIKVDAVEAVYTIDISRLFRDQTLINALTFGELCKQHGVLIITPQMRLNLQDKMHLRIYRMEAERAAEMLDVMRLRLHGGQAIKARLGYYTGESLPPGYIVDVDKTITLDGQEVDNPNYHRYVVYEPHAFIIRKLFGMARVPGATVAQIVWSCRADGVCFPAFSDEISGTAHLKAFAKSRPNPDGSWSITMPRVRSILRNPTYIGWWIWKGEKIRESNHPDIVKEEDFWAAQSLFDDRPHRPKARHPPLPLSGLLYCGDHEPPRRMMYSHGTSGSGNHDSYQCRDEVPQTHCTVRARYLDGPIGEAVISQCAFPELADQVLSTLADEYEQAKRENAVLGREYGSLSRQIENLAHNFANAKLTPARAAVIEAEIQQREARLKEIVALQRDGRGERPTISEDDIELVKTFLSDLECGWEAQPPELKNAFLRLVLDRVTVWHSPALIRVRLTWRTGLEQGILIRRPYLAPAQNWTESEVEVLSVQRQLQLPIDDN